MMTIGELLKKSWEILRQNWKFLVKVNVASFVLWIVAWTIFFVTAALGLFLPTGTDSDLLGMSAISIASFAGVVLLVYVLTWIATTYLLATKLVVDANIVPVKEVFKRSRVYVGRFFVLGVLISIAAVGGFVWFIIPAVMFGIWFFASQYVVINDNVSALVAMDKSRELVRGKFWQVFGRFVLVGLGYIIISAVLGELGWVGALVSLVLSLIWGLGLPIYTYLVFLDLNKEEKKIKSTSGMRPSVMAIIVGVLGIVFAGYLVISLLGNLPVDLFSELGNELFREYQLDSGIRTN